jgi:hypothetical protein
MQAVCVTDKQKEDWMKRAIFLATLALLAMLALAPVALAQDTMMMEESSMMMEDSQMMGGQMEDSEMMMEDSEMMMEDTGTAGQQTDDDLPGSGGPAILLPAAALLLGSGILTYAVLRRR